MTEELTQLWLHVPPERRPCRALVVDDHPVNRTLLVRLLHRAGFTLNQASNGAEAFTLWQTWRPHLILMDLRMPEVNGYEATQLIRAAETPANATPIIALTADDLTNLAPKLHRAGFDSIMTKPVRPAILFKLMARHLHLQYGQKLSPAADVPATS